MLKVVGGYVPVNAEGAIDACIDAFSQDMVKRLAYLDEVNAGAMLTPDGTTASCDAGWP